jgi:hypothetical protein
VNRKRPNGQDGLVGAEQVARALGILRRHFQRPRITKHMLPAVRYATLDPILFVSLHTAAQPLFVRHRVNG